MSHFIINHECGRVIFFITYNLAFLLVLAIFIRKNSRNGNSLVNTLVAAGSGVLFFVLGLYLSSMSFDDLAGLIEGRAPRLTHEKNLIGGLAGLIFGVLLAAGWLRMRKGILDDFAIGIPLGMAVHRIGCLAAGCCFGRPSELPWSVCYTQGSQAFHFHPSGSPLPGESLISVPVHPVQLYEIILCILISIIVWKGKKWFRTPGNLFWFSVLLYCIAWFFCEFFRDPAAVYIAGKVLFGLRIIQWGLLFASLILLSAINYRERKYAARPEKLTPPRTNGLFHCALMVAFLSFGFLLFKDRLEIIDKLLIGLVLLPAISLVSVKIYRMSVIPTFRTLLLILLVSSLFFMSQSYLPTKKGEKVNYTEVGISGMWNGFSNTVKEAVGSYTECGETHYYYDPPEEHRHNVFVVGIHVNDNNIYYNKHARTFYCNGLLGIDNEKGVNNDFDKMTPLVAVNPGGKFTFPYVEFRTGIWAGYFELQGLKTSVHDVGDFSGNVMKFLVFPQLGLTIGPREILYLNMGGAEANQSLAVPLLFQFGLGSGFGKVNGTSLEAGISSIGPYVYGTFPVNDRCSLSICASGMFGKNYFNNYNNLQFSLGFQYRMDYKLVERATNIEPKLEK